LQHFAGENLRRNKRSFQISGLEKLPNYKFAKTHLMADLVAAQSHRAVNAPLTAYLFTSSGQKSEIDIFHLPSSVISFISAARRLYPSAWLEVVERAKVLQADKEEVEEPGKPVYQERNFFYEDLFELPHRAAYFLRRYLMRLPIRGKPTGKQKIDPRYSYSFVTERRAISWGLTVLFLEKVMRMDKERIESIRKMGDGLAEYIQKTDRRLFKQLFTARNDYHMRLALLKAANNAQNTLLKWDEFINVFFVDEGDTLRPDWYLARDLLMLRIIEQLHQEDWIEHNVDLIDETNSAIELPEDQ
jgi:CRISPR-associated protein Cst1